MSRTVYPMLLSIFVAWTGLLPGAEPTPAGGKYLEVVRKAADELLKNARDTYGTQQSGMILSVLDIKTAKPLTKLPKAPTGVRSGDRTVAGGSNANLQQDLYRVLFHLSRLTGDPRYGREATLALTDFLRITQHPDTGLIAWGEHLSWDCINDKAATLEKTFIHEPKRKFLFFDLCYQADSERTLKYARGLWEHQIHDQKTGDFSRHARYDAHGPGKGYDFAKEGSYFIDTWSRAYDKTRDPIYQTAIRVLAKRYLGRSNEKGLLDWDSTGLKDRVNGCTPLWLLSLAVECHDSAPRVDEETAQLLKRLAASQDKGFLSLAHAPDDRERGFVYFAFTDSGKPRPRPERKSLGYSKHWGIGYGIHATSSFGLLCNTRQTQLGATPVGDTYRRMVIRTADLYRSAPPPSTSEDVWAGEYGMAILVELAAYRLTKDKAYLETAETLAQHTLNILWADDAVLPRASSKSTYYDVISYPDTLLMALLALHEHSNGLEPRLEISDLVR